MEVTKHQGKKRTIYYMAHIRAIFEWTIGAKLHIFHGFQKFIFAKFQSIFVIYFSYAYMSDHELRFFQYNGWPEDSDLCKRLRNKDTI